MGLGGVLSQGSVRVWLPWCTNCHMTPSAAVRLLSHHATYASDSESDSAKGHNNIFLCSQFSKKNAQQNTGFKGLFEIIVLDQVDTIIINRYYIIASNSHRVEFDAKSY